MLRDEAIAKPKVLSRGFASRFISTSLKQQYHDVRWQDLADLGNVLRHAYHRVSHERVLLTAKLGISPLKMVLLRIKQNENDHPSSAVTCSL